MSNISQSADATGTGVPEFVTLPDDVLAYVVQWFVANDVLEAASTEDVLFIATARRGRIEATMANAMTGTPCLHQTDGSDIQYLETVLDNKRNLIAWYGCPVSRMIIEHELEQREQS